MPDSSPADRYPGGCRNFCEYSLELKTFADIAEWFLAAIQRKSPSENGFEVKLRDWVPLDRDLLATKGTTQKFNELFGANHAEVQRKSWLRQKVGIFNRGRLKNEESLSCFATLKILILRFSDEDKRYFYRKDIDRHSHRCSHRCSLLQSAAEIAAALS